LRDAAGRLVCPATSRGGLWITGEGVRTVAHHYGVEIAADAGAVPEVPLHGRRDVVQGEVQEKFERDGKAMVKCYVECVNHRDEVTAKGVAEAELARR